MKTRTLRADVANFVMPFGQTKELHTRILKWAEALVDSAYSEGFCAGKREATADIAANTCYKYSIGHRLGDIFASLLDQG